VQLVVTESADGGATWSQKFTTSSAIRSGQPGVAILESGAIGLLYNSPLGASLSSISQKRPLNSMNPALHCSRRKTDVLGQTRTI
jgi:hypothetical protein